MFEENAVVEGMMRGSNERSEGLFSYVNCEARVQADHRLLPISKRAPDAAAPTRRNPPAT
ncbi:hypothetical protein EJ903_06005 [Azospirillum griseum]|uniref:Uncharacterized protein n=1 Tax=Azospirillum griseum TaxID=2496639 RepID=A0A431VKX0_9PROT|nr:hypothetical protein EJ903_06005 [Azospirillum griseum]